jgi:hypothetical protein
MSEYILGALTMLVGCVTGYVMGLAKPYMDRRFNRAVQKPPQQGGTP